MNYMLHPCYLYVLSLGVYEWCWRHLFCMSAGFATENFKRDGQFEMCKRPDFSFKTVGVKAKSKKVR